jgi:hypothetical protein
MLFAKSWGGFVYKQPFKNNFLQILQRWQKMSL